VAKFGRVFIENAVPNGSLRSHVLDALFKVIRHIGHDHVSLE
jgi:hypothetical protein